MRLIDADAMRNDWLENGEDEYVYDTNAMVDSIDAQPTIDAVPVVHGRWGTIERDEVKSEIVVECSECGAVFASTIFTFALNYNYCPTCAAKMDGEEK